MCVWCVCGVCCHRGVADFLLSVSSGSIIVVGSYQLVKCIRKKAKTAAKMSKKVGGLSKPKKKTQVHPL